MPTRTPTGSCELSPEGILWGAPVRGRAAHRGQGVATALPATVERTARSTGRRQLLLSVIARNTGARAFWHRQGIHMLTPQEAGAAAPLDQW